MTFHRSIARLAPLLFALPILAAAQPGQSRPRKLTEHTYRGVCDYSLHLLNEDPSVGYAAPTKMRFQRVSETDSQQVNLRQGYFSGSLYMDFSYSPIGSIGQSCEKALPADMKAIRGFPGKVVPATVAGVQLTVEKIDGVVLATPKTYVIGNTDDITVLNYRGFNHKIHIALDPKDLKAVLAGHGGETVVTAKLTIPMSLANGEVSWELTPLPAMVMSALNSSASETRSGRATVADLRSAVLHATDKLITAGSARVSTMITAESADALNRLSIKTAESIASQITGNVLAYSRSLDSKGSEIELTVVERGLRAAALRYNRVTLSAPAVDETIPSAGQPPLRVEVRD